MYKTTIILISLAISTFAAEISSSYSLLEKNTNFQPDVKTKQVETREVFKKDLKESKDVEHPIYRPEEARARIQPVKSNGPVIKHENMLADQPESTEVDRVDKLTIPNYAYMSAPVEVAYPDIPYAPGYGYEHSYAASNNYDMYGNNGLSSYAFEPDTSVFSLLWSQMPDGRSVVNFMGKTFVWFVNSIFVLVIGSILTVGLCSYTNLCTITFHGVGPIHEEMRSLVTPERLEKISHAADFVKNAIDKYQKIQQVAEVTGQRKRRSIFSFKKNDL